MIQIEDPQIHYAAYFGQGQDVIDFLVDLLNYIVEGLEETEVWIHTCWGNAGSQGAPSDRRRYDESVDTYLNRLNTDVLQIESKDSNHEPLELFRPYKGKMRMKLAVGCISHRTLQVETPEGVADDIRRWLEVVDADHLALGSDCGFGRQGVPRRKLLSTRQRRSRRAPTSCAVSSGPARRMFLPPSRTVRSTHRRSAQESEGLRHDGIRGHRSSAEVGRRE